MATNPRRTLATVNKAIAAAGIPAELVKGKGYFYFVGDTVDTSVPGVYVNALNELSVESWIEEAKAAQVKADPVQVAPVEASPVAPVDVVKQVPRKATSYRANVVQTLELAVGSNQQPKPRRRSSKMALLKKLAKYYLRAA